MPCWANIDMGIFAPVEQTSGNLNWEKWGGGRIKPPLVLIQILLNVLITELKIQCLIWFDYKLEINHFLAPFPFSWYILICNHWGQDGVNWSRYFLGKKG